jgi:hypothetical protein
MNTRSGCGLRERGGGRSDHEPTVERDLARPYPEPLELAIVFGNSAFSTGTLPSNPSTYSAGSN